MRRLTPATIVLLSLTACSRSQAQCTPDCKEHRAITVTATDSVTADAELAIVRVGYRLYGPDAKSAYASASEASHAIMDALIHSGIPRSAIESSSQILQPPPPYELERLALDTQERSRRQFTALQGWTIRTRPEDAAKALNTAINSGANESGWIQWAVDHPNALQAQASAKALADARAIAEQMAQRSNVHIGHLVTANENQGGPNGLNNQLGSAMGGIIGGISGANGFGQGEIPALAMNSRRVECTVTLFATFSIE